MAPVEFTPSPNTANTTKANYIGQSAKDDKRGESFPEKGVLKERVSSSRHKKLQTKTRNMIAMQKVKEILIKPVPVPRIGRSRATTTSMKTTSAVHKFFNHHDL